ncbi:nucleotide exchange factor GrpE [Alkalibacterium olivapovliticus]|uniref:Protein GrpE n=1 Tax=Alkalibacterium olivapovliticus TaxID=99907 RepID=A0A2T0WBP8_9LACT|nr:nucleotide exchange factor GrpE [Alkalibacterium olivapovliticus]PRY84132.1 molecular chaperone GrpE [Alkalibacterium olivapovliticus]
MDHKDEEELKDDSQNQYESDNESTDDSIPTEDTDSSSSDSSELSELEVKQKELDEMTDRYYRLQAELANMRKRNQRDREDLLRYKSQSLAKELLPAYDNIERALNIEVDTEAGNNLKKGIEMVFNSLLEAFKKEGIEIVDPLGEPFDPNFHEAYTQVPANEGQESNEVSQVFEKGFKLHDRVLRAAKVSVTL